MNLIELLVALVERLKALAKFALSADESAGRPQPRFLEVNWHVPDGRPVRYLTSYMDGQPIKVAVLYSVSGCTHAPGFPFVFDIPSLKEAVQAAMPYRRADPQVCGGRVQRYLKALFPGSEDHSLSWQTHEWSVHADGRIELSSWPGNATRRPRSPGSVLAEHLRTTRFKPDP